MSRVYFHFEDGEDVEVRGAERAWASRVCNSLALALVGDQYDSWIAKYINPKHYLHSMKGEAWERSFPAAVGADYRGDLFVREGKAVESFSLVLNTATVLGSEPVRLLARLHAQCEIHAWLEEANRKWYAEKISLGLRDKVLRRSMGWEELAERLTDIKSHPGAVVTSYSVCEQFPHPMGADEYRGDERDAFFEKPHAEQWAFAIDRLRRSSLEWKPETWTQQAFGHGLTFLDLRNEAGE